MARAKKLKGHKNGCGCVGCSPAARKRGMAALKKASSGKRKASKRPAAKKAPAKRAAPKRKGRKNGAENVGRAAGKAVRKVGQGAAAVGRGVRSAAKAALCDEARENGRKAPRKKAAAKRPAAAKKPSKRAASVALPATKRGHYTVTVKRKGGATSVRSFPTVAAANKYAKSLKDITRAVVARVSSNWT